MISPGVYIRHSVGCPLFEDLEEEAGTKEAGGGGGGGIGMVREKGKKEAGARGMKSINTEGRYMYNIM
jgi:hypothetical protein